MDYSYKAFVFQQRADGNGPTLALFHAPAGQVAAWADVDRLGPDNKLAPQREPKKSRINSIRRFFSDNVENTIPTAIVVGLRGVAMAGDGAIRTITLTTKTVNRARV